MSYISARHCFEDNTERLDVHRDPVAWNLNNGLLNLSGAIEEDLQKIVSLLTDVVAALNRR